MISLKSSLGFVDPVIFFCRLQCAAHFAWPCLPSGRHPVEPQLAALLSLANYLPARQTGPSDLGRLCRFFCCSCRQMDFLLGWASGDPVATCGGSFSAAFFPFLVFCFFAGGCSQSQLRLSPPQEPHNAKQWILVWPACPQRVHLVTRWNIVDCRERKCK